MSRRIAARARTRLPRYGSYVLIAMMTGCTTPIPQALTPQLTPKEFTGVSVNGTRAWPSADWWQAFDSQELSDLIAEAQAGNFDLAAATARVLQSQAQSTIARAALFPELNLQAQAQRSAIGGGLPTNGQNQGTAINNSFALSLGASYELDLWGLARNNLRAAQEALKSAGYARQTVAMTLIANVANEWFNILALRRRIAIANENIAAIEGILTLIRLRVQTGASSNLDLAREQAQVEAVKAQLPVLEEQELEARVALAVLLGRLPEAFTVESRDLDAVQLPSVEPGLSSELLRRRPDVAAAEAKLAAAHANLDAARAAFLPQFNLSGSGGFASTAIRSLLHGPSFAWSYGAELTQAVFAGGKLVGQKNLAQATQSELIASYRSAVISAYADVENALGQVTNNTRAEDHLEREVEAAREAFEISQLQYRQGTTDLLNVLQAQQTLFLAEDQLAQTRLAHMQAVVHLFQALGGGWVQRSEERTQFSSAGSIPSSQ
jgi:multidrug efflux system outer membrane protein